MGEGLLSSAEVLTMPHPYIFPVLHATFGHGFHQLCTLPLELTVHQLPAIHLIEIGKGASGSFAISSYAHAYSAAARGEHLPARENSRKERIVFGFLCWVRLRLIVGSAREAVLDSLPGLDFARRCSGCMPASSLSSALLGMYASFSLISLLLSGTADLCSRVVASFLVPFWHHFGHRG